MALPDHELMIPWPTLPRELQQRAVRPDNPAYRLLQSVYMKKGNPSLVLRPEGDEEIAAGLRYAVEVRQETGTRVPFSVRSGGHGLAGTGTNTGGIVLDLSRNRQVEWLDPGAGLFRVDAGASWGDVAPLLTARDRALTTGNFGDTGVGGLATAGGVGYLARSQGLTIDHLVRVKVATPDGAVRWVDADNEPDLFWAMRGGATQAGLALSFDIQAPELRSSAGQAHVILHNITYLTTDLPQFVENWGDWIRNTPREMESFLMLQSAGVQGIVVSAKNVWSNDNVTAVMPSLQQAQGLDRVLDGGAHITPYTGLIPTPRQPHVGQQNLVMRDVLVDHASRDLGEAMAEMLAHRTTLLGELRSLGGAVSDVDPLATAWAGRHQEVLAAGWHSPHGNEAVNEAFAPVRALGTGMYGAYSSDTSLEAARLTWPGETGKKLIQIAELTDPDFLFDEGLTLRQSE